MIAAAQLLPASRLRRARIGRAHVASGAVLGVVGALYLFAGASVAGMPSAAEQAGAAAPHAAAQAAAAKAPPPAEPLQFKEVAPQDAVAINAAVPVSDAPNPAAVPFRFTPSSAESSTRALECLTAAIYYEAATEPADGQRAVAQVVLNRVRHPAYPDTVCGVVFQGAERSTGCQFTFTCDGSLARAPAASYWRRAGDIAKAALAGYVYKPVGWATHYHTNWVVPYWSSSLVKAANVGTHIFYRWEGGWGRAPAFANRYAGKEPVLPKMRYIGVGGEPVEELTPEAEAVLAAGEVSPDKVAPDMKNRAVVQRFEPATREGVAQVLAKQTAPGAKVDDSLRWALTGEREVSGEAFGKKADVPAPAPAVAAGATP